MALSDAKKCQTLINRAGDEMAAVRAAVTRIEATRALFVTASPSVVGTPLEGNLTTLENALTALRTEVDKAVWTGLINARVPSHEGKAL